MRLIHKNKRIKESFEGQEYFGKIDPEHIENVVDKLEEKLKEYIIDENEIEAIGRCWNALLKCENLHFYDRLDIVYKYSRLYFKEYDKQDIILVRCDEVGDDKCYINIDEESDPNKKKYCEIMHYLGDWVDSILEQCKGDVSQLDTYPRKMFLQLWSIAIVGLRFPHKYGFLSLDPVKIEASCREKIEMLEDKIKDWIVITKYIGKIPLF